MPILTVWSSEDDCRTERAVADGIARLHLEVVGGPWTETVDGGRRLVVDDAFHDPLAIRLSRVRRVEQQVTYMISRQSSSPNLSIPKVDILSIARFVRSRISIE